MVLETCHQTTSQESRLWKIVSAVAFLAQERWKRRIPLLRNDLFAGCEFSIPTQPIQAVKFSEQGLFLAACPIPNTFIINYRDGAGTGNPQAGFPHAKYLTG